MRLYLHAFNFADPLVQSLIDPPRQNPHKELGSVEMPLPCVLPQVSYVEYQRNHRMVLKVHKDALIALRNFWKQLMHSKVGRLVSCMMGVIF